MKLGRRALVLPALLAAAAAIAGTFAWRSGDAARHPELPDYAVGRVELATGTPGGAGDAPFEIVATPASPVAASLKLAAFAFAMTEGDADPNAVDAKVDIAADGTVRIKGRGRALSGAREVRVVIGAATDFKRYEDALAAARIGADATAARHAQLRVLVAPIVRTPRR